MLAGGSSWASRRDDKEEVRNLSSKTMKVRLVNDGYRMCEQPSMPKENKILRRTYSQGV
jgi:hypothetical protein